MSVQSLGLYDARGRIKGCYVYMLLCRDGAGPIYVKIGIASDPLARLGGLRTACPLPPKLLIYASTRSRDVARRIESQLLLQYKHWKTTGEWFRVEYSDKAEFNARWKRIFEFNEEPTWKYRWEKLDVQAYIRLMERRRIYRQKSFRKRGKAYQDFVGAGGLRS